MTHSYITIIHVNKFIFLMFLKLIPFISIHAINTYLDTCKHVAAMLYILFDLKHIDCA